MSPPQTDAAQEECVVYGPINREVYVGQEFVTVSNDITRQFRNTEACFETYGADPMVRRFVFDLSEYPEAISRFMRDFITGRVGLELVDDESLPWVFEILVKFNWEPVLAAIRRRLETVRDKCVQFILKYCFLDRRGILDEYRECRDVTATRRWVRNTTSASHQWNGSDMGRLLRMVPPRILAECILMDREHLHRYTHARVDVFAEETRRTGYFRNESDFDIPEPITPPVLRQQVLRVSDAKFRFCAPGDFWRRFDEYTLGLFSPDGEMFAGYDSTTQSSELGSDDGFGDAARRRKRHVGCRPGDFTAMRALHKEVRVTGGLMCKLIRGPLPDYETDIDLFVQEDFVHEAVAVILARFPGSSAGVQNGSIVNVRVPDPAYPEDPSRVRKFQVVPGRNPMVDIFKFDLTNNMLWVVPGRRVLYASPVAYADLIDNQATMMTPFTKPYRFQKAGAVVGHIRVAGPFCLEGCPDVLSYSTPAARLHEIVATGEPNPPQEEVPYVQDMQLGRRGDYIARFPKVFRYSDPRYNVENLSTFYRGITAVSFDRDYFTIGLGPNPQLSTPEEAMHNLVLTVRSEAVIIITRVLSNLCGLQRLKTPVLTPVFIGAAEVTTITFRLNSRDRQLELMICTPTDYRTLYTKYYTLAITESQE